ncbi:MAG: HAMP domain-containing protein [Calothrix sp. SM1_7_51]|nr:HAMP domain-containing protein [Calothrix sp. SM1_7_51]
MNWGKGRCFLVIDRQGLLIADSINHKTYNVTSSKNHKNFQLIRAENSKNPLIQAASSYFKTSYNNQFTNIKENEIVEFFFNKERHFLQVISYQDKLGLDWLVVLVKPESQFMNEINTNNNITIIICLIALILGVLLSINTSGLLSKPLRDLSNLATAIANGDLEQKLKQDGFAETRILMKAFNQMSHS